MISTIVLGGPYSGPLFRETPISNSISARKPRRFVLDVWPCDVHPWRTEPCRQWLGDCMGSEAIT